MSFEDITTACCLDSISSCMLCETGLDRLAFAGLAEGFCHPYHGITRAGSVLRGSFMALALVNYGACEYPCCMDLGFFLDVHGLAKEA
jgi:hypothetical protein